MPNEYRDLAILVSDQHQNIHNAFELKAETIIKVFDKADFWRKPQRLQQMLICCHADMRGRTGFEQAEYPQQAYLESCFEAASNVDVKQIILDGFQGAEIKQQLHQKRIEVVQALKQQIRNK